MQIKIRNYLRSKLTASLCFKEILNLMQEAVLWFSCPDWEEIFSPAEEDLRRGFINVSDAVWAGWNVSDHHSHFLATDSVHECVTQWDTGGARLNNQWEQVCSTCSTSSLSRHKGVVNPQVSPLHDDDCHYHHYHHYPRVTTSDTSSECHYFTTILNTRLLHFTSSQQLMRSESKH